MNSEGSFDVEGGVSNPDGAQTTVRDNKPQGALGNRRRSPASVGFEIVEPWPEPVNGAELLDTLAKELQRFVVLSKWAAETFALWILHSYAYRLRDVTSYMGIESPERECGKSTLLTVLSQLVDRAAISSNISPSALFRSIEELEPTLLIDEADTNLRGKDDLGGILNSGYTKSTAFVWRMCYDSAPGEETDSGTAGGRVARYSCWCPKAIAGIGRLPATLASRCIVVQMQRKTEREECERLKRLEAGELKRKCARFVADHAKEIAEAEPQIPVGLANRAADIWEPLLVLAELAGGRWPELARAAAVGLTTVAKERNPIGALLLDILVVFTLRRCERIFSRDLVEGLIARGDRPWVELCKRKGVTDMWLAQQLRPYGLRPKSMRIGDQLGKGYLHEDFRETFKRYIPRSELEELRAEAAANEAIIESKVEKSKVEGSKDEGRRDGESSEAQGAGLKAAV